MFLNHGSFGACPRAVLDAQSSLRGELERDPVRFFDGLYRPAIARARAELAGFLGAEADDIAFVTNVTTGINAVMRSLDLAAGDEVLTTTHEYNATRNALDYAAGRAGARVIAAELPFPLRAAGEAIDAILARVTSATKLAVIDHITSQSALVLPIAEIAAALSARGVPLLVDGAHAAGQIDLDVPAIGARYYAGNCHKWLCAPKGAGFLWVDREFRDAVRPTVISHGANAPVAVAERFRLEFEWTGTHDPTAALCVPVAIAVVGEMVDGGWPAVRRRNRALALSARALLCEAAGTELPCPDEMIGTMAAVPLPDSRLPAPAFGQPHPLQAVLYERHRVQVPVFPWRSWPGQMLRISAHLHNRPEEYEVLARALRAEC